MWENRRRDLKRRLRRSSQWDKKRSKRTLFWRERKKVLHGWRAEDLCHICWGAESKEDWHLLISLSSFLISPICTCVRVHACILALLSPGSVHPSRAKRPLKLPYLTRQPLCLPHRTSSFFQKYPGYFNLKFTRILGWNFIKSPTSLNAEESLFIYIFAYKLVWWELILSLLIYSPHGVSIYVLHS